MSQFGVKSGPAPPPPSLPASSPSYFMLVNVIYYNDISDLNDERDRKNEWKKED